MPIYEYRCQDCGHYVDVLQKLSDEPLKRCPECETDSLKRLISAPAFRLKGGGWYETDFKSEKEKRRNLADGGEGAKAEKGNGESKSAEGGSKGEGGASKSGEGGSKSGESGSTSGSSSEKPTKKSAGDGSQSKAAV